MRDKTWVLYCQPFLAKRYCHHLKRKEREVLASWCWPILVLYIQTYSCLLTYTVVCTMLWMKLEVISGMRFIELCSGCRPLLFCHYMRRSKPLLKVWFLILSYISVIQFCSTAFAYYAQATAAQEIFGHTLQSLRGIKYLYKWVLYFEVRCFIVYSDQACAPYNLVGHFFLFINSSQVQRFPNRIYCSCGIDLCVLCCLCKYLTYLSSSIFVCVLIPIWT